MDMPHRNGTGTGSGSDRQGRGLIRLVTTNGEGQTDNQNPHATSGELVDFGKAREQKIEDKRRKTERVFFRNLLGVYCVTAPDAMAGVELVDVSEDGVAFQVRFDAKNPWPRDMAELPLRLYFTEESYLEIGVRIQNSRQTIEAGTRMVRYGCTVDKEWSSYEAYLQFVRFLKSYAEHNHRDTGHTKISYL
jgi:hypothetical protein